MDLDTHGPCHHIADQRTAREREPLETVLHDYMSLMLGKLAAIGRPQLISHDVLSGLGA